jgi:hypothetical protein
MLRGTARAFLINSTKLWFLSLKERKTASVLVRYGSRRLARQVTKSSQVKVMTLTFLKKSKKVKVMTLTFLEFLKKVKVMTLTFFGFLKKVKVMTLTFSCFFKKVRVMTLTF